MTAYTYDGNDNLTKRRTPKGDDILFAYDKGGREYLFDGWIAFKTPDPFFAPHFLLSAVRESTASLSQVMHSPWR